MAIIKPTKPYAFTNGTGNTADADEVNEDFDVLYAKIDELIDILNNSAGTKTALANRLAVAINDDGTLRSAVSAGGEWVMPGLTAAYVSATQFTVSGDQTDIYLPGSAAGRRLKVTLAASTVYTKVSAATYSAGTGLTTVTIANNVLTNPITSVEHGNTSPVASGKSSLPADTAAVANTIPVRDNAGALPGDILGNAATATNATNAANADTVDNFHVQAGTTYLNRIPVVGSDGVIEVGRYVDFHAADADAKDYQARLACGVGTDSNLYVDTNKIHHNGNVFTGRVNAAGAAVKMPSGWVVAKLATGRYEITHFLGHANYTVSAVISQRTTASAAITAFTSTYAGIPTTRFDIYTVSKDGIVTDADFDFTVILD